MVTSGSYMGALPHQQRARPGGGPHGGPSSCTPQDWEAAESTRMVVSSVETTRQVNRLPVLRSWKVIYEVGGQAWHVQNQANCLVAIYRNRLA